jgi:hypothetical protein
MTAEPYIEQRDNGFLILHQDRREYALGLVTAGEIEYGGTCGRALRGGRYCTMDHSHRGRCSSVTFCCDGCGKQRRGQPAAQDEGGWYCFMCVASDDRGYHSYGPAIYLGMSPSYRRHVREWRERERQRALERRVRLTTQ